ncbi:MAG: helix-turn-helix domain-containing protein [Rhodospirillaceae bacterium]|nr:helix-turn-helix domain-containing protein [Rhodospirillaceae bacterium]
MTPFGAKMRDLREKKGVTQKEMAHALKVSGAYLSALEHGNRGRPGPGLIHQICEYFELIWDDAEELKTLAESSHPRIVVDTAGLSPAATKLANLLARSIHELDDNTIQWIMDEIEAQLKGGGSRGPSH